MHENMILDLFRISNETLRLSGVIGLKPRKFGSIWVDLEKYILARLIELGQGLTHSDIAKTIPRYYFTSNYSMGFHC